MAVSCSHGVFADPLAIDGALRFRKAFKPHIILHLGDFLDATAFRSGARGTVDESAPVSDDLISGLDFLDRLQPQHILAGNHERRLFKLRGHHNAVVSHCATVVCNEIYDTTKKLRAKWYPYNRIDNVATIGGIKFMHGIMWNQMSCRDHAETFGTCAYGHTHTVQMAQGRRDDYPTAWNIGCLTNIPAMEYADTRRQTYAWSQGLLYGEVAEGKHPDHRICLLNVGQNLSREKWRLPL